MKIILREVWFAQLAVTSSVLGSDILVTLYKIYTTDLIK
jgi:hypothetical protein